MGVGLFGRSIGFYRLRTSNWFPRAVRPGIFIAPTNEEIIRPGGPVCLYVRAPLSFRLLHRFINSFAGKLGSRTFSAVSTPATGRLAVSIKPSWANTDAWS